ncbi:hypothetical protein L9F63_011145, partial [Diploptera punctata]
TSLAFVPLINEFHSLIFHPDQIMIRIARLSTNRFIYLVSYSTILHDKCD